jgi:hypothetical protein
MYGKIRPTSVFPHQNYGPKIETLLNTFVFLFIRLCFIIISRHEVWGTALEQWLRYCATNRKVAGSIPDVVIGIFH